jgi:predicted RNA-binding protein (virulence factor B family)
VLRVLTMRPELALGDKSTPAEILAATGLSKKAFKRALGQLFKERRVEIQAGIATPNTQKT